MKFTLIPCQILPAKSIVANMKNHKVVGCCLLWGSDRTLERIRRESKWPSSFNQFYCPKPQPHSTFKFILAVRLTKFGAKQGAHYRVNDEGTN